MERRLRMNTETNIVRRQQSGVVGEGVGSSQRRMMSKEEKQCELIQNKDKGQCENIHTEFRRHTRDIL